MERLKELKEQEEILKAQLKENIEQQKEVLIEQWGKKYGIKIGDKISIMDYKTEVVGILKAFECWLWNESVARIVIAPFKKDGTESKKEVTISSHEFPTLKKIG